MTVHPDNAPRMLTCLAGLLLLAACGGGGGSGEPVAVVEPASPIADDKGGLDVGAALPLEQWLAEGLVFEDRDGDGIEDALDTWPDDRPLLAAPSSSQSLTIRRAWTEVDGATATATAIEGMALRLEVEGLPANGGQDLWVVFQTTQGLRAVKPTVETTSRLSAMPPAGTIGVHVVSGSSRGLDVMVHGLAAGQPVLFDTRPSLFAGRDQALQGRNLDQIDRAYLGDQELVIRSQSMDEIVVALPAAPTSNRFVTRGAVGPSNALELDLRQTVELGLGEGIVLAADEQLRLRFAGVVHWLTAAQATTVDVPAWKPVVLSFDLVAGANVRSYGRVRAVVWPGDARGEITLQGSLVGRLLRIRDQLPGLGGNDWQAIRDKAALATTSEAAAAYFAALSAHVTDGVRAPTEASVIAAVQAYRDLVTATAAVAAADKEGTVSYAVPTTSWGGDLDAMIGSTLTYIGQDTGKGDGDAPEAGYSYPQQTFGNSYSQVVILRHGDDNLFATGFQSFSGCQYSSDEQAWYTLRQTSADPWKRVWRSDLCVQVDGLPFISAAVVQPGFRDPQAIFDAMAAGQKPRQLSRRHALPEFFDDGYQWGTGGYYLRGDDGLPLCHMETCYVEVITSGYGAYASVPLSSSQEKLVETMRVRMWVESIIPWIMGLVDNSDGGLPINGPDPVACIRKDLMQKGGLYTAAKNLDDFIQANRTKTGDDLVLAIYDGIDQKIAPWVRDYVSNRVDDTFSKCLASYDFAGDIENAIKDKLLATAGLAGFVEVYNFVQNLGSAVLTPEKFVFKVQPRAEIESVWPREINLYSDDTLEIDGDWLIRSDPNAATACGGNGYCPQLIAVDKLGLSKSIQLDASHFSDTVGNCEFGCNIRIPFADLAPFQDLVSGPLRLELALYDADYASYPGGYLRIPVPGNVMTLKTRAKMQSINPPLAKVGETITVKGTGLSAYGASAVFELAVENGTFPNVSLARAENTSTPDEEVRLDVPFGAQNGLYRVVVKPGADAPVSGLDPLESTTRVAIVASERQWVIVGDQGIVKDDHIRIEYLDVNDNIVRHLRLNRDMVLELPIYEQIEYVTQERYVAGFEWDDADDPNSPSGLVDVSDFVVKVRIECIDGGQDGTCTWGIRSLRDKLCTVAGGTAKPAMVGKVRDNETNRFRDYYLAPGETTCDVVVP